MLRSGRHRLPRPTRLLALIVALLVGTGLMVATSTAWADSSDDKAVSSSDRRSGDNRGDDDRDGKQRSDKGDRKGDRDGNRDRDDDDDDDRGKARAAAKGDGDDKDDDKNGKNRDGKNGDKDGGKDGGKNNDGKKDEEDEEFPGRDKASPPDDDDFVDIREVSPNVDEPSNQSDASTGTFVARCGRNENNHRNSDNYIVAPNKRNGAQHVHDYVGNLSTDAFSDDDNLLEAGTTCDRNNKSVFYWPVLRDTSKRGDDVNEDGGGLDGNFGQILRPASVDLRFRGNPTEKVTPMPEGLRIITGDAKAKTNGDKNANAKWTCTGFEDRETDKYPLCPSGSKIVRILDFPSCWDGRNLDSEDHRSHIIFPEEDGSCRDGFEAVPQLRMTLTYDAPDGRNFAMDSFPDQQHDPRTDHGDFENLAPDEVNELAADCINDGRNC